MAFSTEVACSSRIGGLSIPFKDCEFRISALNHKPAYGAVCHCPADLASEFVERCHKFLIIDYRAAVQFHNSGGFFINMAKGQPDRASIKGHPEAQSRASHCSSELNFVFPVRREGNNSSSARRCSDAEQAALLASQMSHSSQNQFLQTRQTVLEFPTLHHGGIRLPNLLLRLVDCLSGGARRHNCHAKSFAIENLQAAMFRNSAFGETPDRSW